MAALAVSGPRAAPRQILQCEHDNAKQEEQSDSLYQAPGDVGGHVI
jgi:hypothetical protein